MLALSKPWTTSRGMKRNVPAGTTSGPSSKRERELSLDDEEPVGVEMVDVRLRSALARAVGELRDDDLLGVDEYSRTTPWPIGDRLAVDTAGSRNDDEPGVAGGVVRSRLLIERRANSPQLVLAPGGVQAAYEVAEPAARDVDVEEPRRCVSRHREGVYDFGRDEHPGLGPRPVLTVLEPERELALEDEERLRVLRMDMEWRSDTTGSGTDFDDADLLDIGEERHPELTVSSDVLACDELDHRPAA